MSRAGLVSLIFSLLCIGLVASVPLPGVLSGNDIVIPSIHGRYDHAPVARNRSSHDHQYIRSTTKYAKAPDLTDVNHLVPRSIFGKIKKDFQKVGGDIKAGAQEVKQGLDTAGRFVKKDGPTIAKVGLKVVSTTSSVAARVANFIPVIGKPASKLIKLESKGLNMASNAIPVNLTPSLQKTSNILDDIRDPVGAGAKAAGKAIGGKRVLAVAQVSDQIF